MSYRIIIVIINKSAMMLYKYVGGGDRLSLGDSLVCVFLCKKYT